MKSHLVSPGTKVRLAAYDAGACGGFDKEQAEERLKDLADELQDLQYLLYAEHKHKLLVILQGVDASGKDGAIRNVFGKVDPQGVRVASFKPPTQRELDHDYLWRVHQQVPAKGEIVIFNRSHYEDILVPRVHQLVAREVWQRRFEHVNCFERMLADEGTVLLKFFLHIDKLEQKERLERRIRNKKKNWKFDPADLRERARWKDYEQAYEEILSRTTTAWAPWHIVPANHKWYRNLVVAKAVVDALQSLKMSYPKPPRPLGRIVIR